MRSWNLLKSRPRHSDRMSGLDSGYAVRSPAPVLRPFISRYAGSCAHGLTPGTHAGLPSRHVHLIISLGAPIEVLQMPNPAQRAGRFTALVSGLQDAPATVRQSSSWDGVHVFLTPFGVPAILGIPAADVASHVFDLSDLCGWARTSLVERLKAAATWHARFAVLDDVFVRALIPTEHPHAIVWAWRELAASHGRQSIEALARVIGWSRAHFTERFRAEVGLAPKTAARVLRFERACWLIKDARPRLADVAAACGYYDQAHMTREWQALAGCSPRVWIAGELPFLQDYEFSGGDDEV
jgi:AraC-like DNA-binding protein